jgi:hypothetical protein
VRQHEQAPYNRFIGERHLRDLVVDLVAEHDGEIDFAELAEQLKQTADRANAWLVAVTIANLLVPGGYRLIKQDVAALGMSVQDPDWTPWGTDSPFSALTLFHDLKDHLDSGVRWQREDSPIGRLDTRMTAKLFLVQEGTETLALSVAPTRARLALAVWCLLDAPDPMTLWPALGDWLPRPYLLNGTLHKLFEPGQWPSRASKKGAWIHQHSEYTATDDPTKLAAPFEMMRLGQTMAAPRAVLSAAGPCTRPNANRTTGSGPTCWFICARPSRRFAT